MIRRVAKEHTESGTWGELVRGGCRGVWVAFASKNTKVGVVRHDTKESKKRSGKMEGFSGMAVKKVSGSVKRLNPITSRETSLK